MTEHTIRTIRSLLEGDERLREAERAWRSTASISSLIDYNKALLRAGEDPVYPGMKMLAQYNAKMRSDPILPRPYFEEMGDALWKVLARDYVSSSYTSGSPRVDRAFIGQYKDQGFRVRLRYEGTVEAPFLSLGDANSPRAATLLITGGDFLKAVLYPHGINSTTGMKRLPLHSSALYAAESMLKMLHRYIRI